MGTTTVDRRKGIPGSDAAEQVKRMGGPVAQRSSRKTTADGPGVINLKPRSQPWVADDVQDVAEDPPDSDSADIEDWTPPHTTFAERRRELAEQQQRRRTSEDQPTATPERATSNAPLPRRNTDALPRQREHLSIKAALLVGALALIFLYLVIGWLYSAGLGISNRLSYGPTPTFYLDAVVGDHDAPGHPTRLVAMNEHGTIVIQVAPAGDFSQVVTYVMPAQTTFHSWGNLDDIVVTLTVAGKGPAPNILVHLQGDPDISHFYQRPSATFLLLNQQPGFKVGPFMD